MCNNCSSCFFSCAKKSAQSNALWGSAATGGTGACMVKGIADLAGCAIHPAIPISVGLGVGVTSCFIKAVEVCFTGDSEEPSDRPSTREMIRRDMAEVHRRNSI